MSSSFYDNPFDDDFNPVPSVPSNHTTTAGGVRDRPQAEMVPTIRAPSSAPTKVGTSSSSSSHSTNHDRTSTTSSSSSSSGHPSSCIKDGSHPVVARTKEVSKEGKEKKSKSSFYLNSSSASSAEKNGASSSSSAAGAGKNLSSSLSSEVPILSSVLQTGLSLIDAQAKNMSNMAQSGTTQSNVNSINDQQQQPKVPSRRSRYKNERDAIRGINSNLKSSLSSSHLNHITGGIDVPNSTMSGDKTSSGARFDSSIDRRFNRANDSDHPSTSILNELTTGHTTTEYIIRAEMMRNEKEYVDIKPFKLFIGTFNVNGKSGSNVDLKDWLCIKSDLEDHPPDMYALGFQELDLSKEAYVFTESAREEEWINAVSRSLPGHFGVVGVSEDYVQLKVVRLIGMMLIIFLRKEHESYVSNLAIKTVGTGLLGTMGNKGGVSIRFDLGRTSMCFVNCHLAAHQEEVERRNQDYHEILNRTIFTQFRPVKRILDHDQIFWFGDMNYRIDLHSDIIKERIEEIKNGSINFDELIKFDQLIAEKEEGKVFQGFKEGNIHFIPTYKYDVGSVHNWDSSEKNRPPAWCDRILWRRGHGHRNSVFGSGFQTFTSESSSQSSGAEKIFPGADKNIPGAGTFEDVSIPAPNGWSKRDLEPQLLQYRSHPTLTLSDHKPVSALFKTPIKIVDPIKSRKIYTELMKKLDRLENDYLPQVMLDKTDLEFGSNVQLLTPVTKSFTIANTGQVPVNWCFSKKPNQINYCKEWVKVSPSSGYIIPGDAIEVEVTIEIDPKSVSKLNLSSSSCGSSNLNDILVLHLDRGRDLFITITGNYLSNIMDGDLL